MVIDDVTLNFINVKQDRVYQKAPRLDESEYLQIRGENLPSNSIWPVIKIQSKDMMNLRLCRSTKGPKSATQKGSSGEREITNTLSILGPRLFTTDFFSFGNLVEISEAQEKKKLITETNELKGRKLHSNRKRVKVLKKLICFDDVRGCRKKYENNKR